MERVSFWQEVRAGYKGEFPVWVLPAWFVIGMGDGPCPNKVSPLNPIALSKALHPPWPRRVWRSSCDVLELI